MFNRSIKFPGLIYEAIDTEEYEILEEDEDSRGLTERTPLYEPKLAQTDHDPIQGQGFDLNSHVQHVSSSDYHEKNMKIDMYCNTEDEGLTAGTIDEL